MDIDKMKEARKKQKITFDNPAKKSGIPRRTIVSIFSGETPTPRVDTLEAIEKALGIDNSGINVIQNTSLSDKEIRLLTAFNSLIPSMQDYILEMVEKLTEQEQNRKDGAV